MGKKKKPKAPAPLAVRFAPEWKALTGLRELRDVDPKVLEAAIARVVNKYGPMVKLRHNIASAYRDAEGASMAVERIKATIGKLGRRNRIALSGLMTMAVQAKIPKDVYELPSITPMLTDISLQLILLRGALKFVAHADASQIAKPTHFYKIATHGLLDQWLKLVPTAGHIPYPHLVDGHDKHESTVFVFQCLKMIDPEIKESRARTAIQRAREDMVNWKRKNAGAKIHAKNPEKSGAALLKRLFAQYERHNARTPKAKV